MLTVAEKRRACATVLASVALTALQYNRAVQTSIESAILGTVRALASVITFVSLANSTILAWTVFAGIKVLGRESICNKMKMLQFA